MASHCVSNEVLFTFLLLVKLTLSLHSARITEYCSTDILPLNVTTKDRPDSAQEGEFYNEEVITGKACFSVEVLPHRGRNSAHVTVLRHDALDICKQLVVTGAEIMALGYLNDGKREERKPFGNMRQEENITVVEETCGHNGKDLNKPLDEIHVTLSSPDLASEDCIKEKDFLLPDVTNSIRILPQSGQGPSGNSSDTVVACAIWSYIGVNYTYPIPILTPIPIFMEFIAELDIQGPGSKTVFRSVAKISDLNEPVIKQLPPLICTYQVPPPPPPSTTPTTTTTCPTTTTLNPQKECDDEDLVEEVPGHCNKYRKCVAHNGILWFEIFTCTTGEHFNATLEKCVKGACNVSTPVPCIIPTTAVTTTPAPIFEDLPCISHDSCSTTNKYLQGPSLGIFSSAYRSVGDICKCHTDSSTQIKFTWRKYPYGGFHYGLPVQASHPSKVPAEPVKDVVFKDCLQFYYDKNTTCAVFTVDACHADPTVTELMLYEFYIFALGTTDKHSANKALPFGEWELVENSMGNCGDLVNSKAKTQRGQMWTTHYESQVCLPNPLGFSDTDMGMPDHKNPKVWRVLLDKPLLLQGSAANVSQVYAVRFHADAKDFDYRHVPHRIEYLNFVLEAYTQIKTKYDSTPKWQIISMKTPIIHATYHNKMQLQITANISNSHELPYFQLSEEWNDHLHYKSLTACGSYKFPAVIKKPGPLSDNGLENTCRCYSRLRQTGRVVQGNEYPTTVKKFVTDVKPHVQAGHIKIDENCFIFDIELEPPKPIANPVGGCTGNNQQRVFVYFGLTCTGAEAVEVMDMTIQAQNHKGYPVGFWTHTTFAEQGGHCRDTLSKKTGGSKQQWTIREFRPLSTFKCTVTTEPPEQTFLQHEVPSILFFNNNLTANAEDNASYFGHCAWWNYKHNLMHTDNPKNFYFDFQFVATVFLVHRPSDTQYLVTFRSERSGYNVKTCEAHALSKDLRQNDIFINEHYYKDQVLPPEQCIKPLNLIDNFATGICGCYIGFTPDGRNTHRFVKEYYPEKHPAHEYVETFQQCMNLYAAVDNHPQPYSVVAGFQIEASDDCNKFKIFEIIIQALNNDGMPMGSWDTTLVQGGPRCENAKLKGSATVGVFKCPRNTDMDLQKHYKTDANNINAFHFANNWMDDGFDAICARWTYPKYYAERHNNSPHELPLNFQFYAQTHVLHIPSNMLITAPKFTLVKVRFDVGGTFKDLLTIRPFQHVQDFNNYLYSAFHETLASDCLVKYPKPPEYASFSCKMFHPSDLLEESLNRIDLYNEDPDNVRGATYRKARCYFFDVFPGNEPLSMHLRIRQDLSRPKECGAGIHFALTAYNEKGFPIGSTEQKSFSFYDHPYVPSSDNRYCRHEDVSLNSDDVVNEDYGQCPFHPDSANGLEESTMSNFYLQTVKPGSLPGMAIFGVNSENPPKGVCFHWVYDKQPAGQPTPKFIQFYLEIFVPLSKENAVIGNVFLMRSQKFKMNYKAGSPVGSRPVPAKRCHDSSDWHRVFEQVPFPKDWWQKMHNYTIYPDKTSYRKCLSEYKTFKGCTGEVKTEDPIISLNPGVVIPFPFDKNDERAIHRYNSTKAIYNGCITSKLCYSPLQGSIDNFECILEMNCELLWAIGKQPINPMDQHFPDPEENDEIVFELYAATTGWVALAISTDSSMGEDIVFECTKENGSSVVNLHYSWNIGQFKSQSIASRHDNQRYHDGSMKANARLIHYSSDEHSTHCIFYVRSAFHARSLLTSIHHQYDLRSNRYCVLNAFGDSYKPGGGISGHEKAKRGGKASCLGNVRLSTRLMPSRYQVRVLQIHGALLTAVYVGALSLSVFVVRYYKLSFDRLLYSYPLWVWIHSVIATVGGVFVFLDWMLIIVGTKDWISPIASPFHKVIGYLSTIIIFVNIPLGIYIRNTNALYARHATFYIVHGVSGHFALVSGIFVVMLSTHVEHAFVPCATKVVSISFVLLYFLFHIFMSFNRPILHKFLKGPEERKLTLTPFILLTQNAPSETFWYEEVPKATKIRILILVLFIIMLIIYAVLIPITIVNSDHSCALEKSNWYNVPS